jgi:hypothetical protein
MVMIVHTWLETRIWLKESRRLNLETEDEKGGKAENQMGTASHIYRQP